MAGDEWDSSAGLLWPSTKVRVREVIQRANLFQFGQFNHIIDDNPPFLGLGSNNITITCLKFPQNLWYPSLALSKFVMASFSQHASWEALQETMNIWRPSSHKNYCTVFLYMRNPQSYAQKTATAPALWWCKLLVLLPCFLPRKSGVCPEKVGKMVLFWCS